MAVSSTINKVSYTASGSQTVFAYTFKIYEDADLEVYVNGILKTLTTDYAVSNAGVDTGGNVTFGTGLTASDTVVIIRVLDLTQEADYVENDPFPAETHEDALDRLTFITQQHQETLDRTLKFAKTVTDAGDVEILDDANGRANKVFAFDANGDLDATELEIGTFTGNWATATNYVARDIVKDTTNNNIYIASAPHASTGSLPISTNTDVSKWDLLVDAASASSSASAAATSATAAATSATAAATSKTGADTAKTGAETAKTGAETAKTAAETAKTASETAQTATEAVYDSFDDRYLGTKTTDPSTDNDSNTLLDGALYFNTTNNVMMVYDLGGTTWNRTTPTTSDQTKINTVSGIAANITTVAGKDTEIGRLGTAEAVADLAILGTVDIVSDMNTLATTAIVADMNALADKAAELGRLGTTDAIGDMNTLGTTAIVANINTVAGKATEIGLLGTTDAVSDMNTLATSGVISDMNTLATADIVNDMNILATADIVADMNILATPAIVADMAILATNDIVADMAILGTADVVLDMNTLATSDIVSDMNTLGTAANVTNMATVATNITAVNSFADTYRISATAPTTSLNEGDLYFDTATNRMRVYEGSAWIDVALSASSYVTKTGATASAQMPVGTTAQRDSTPAAGMFRYNTTTSDFEGYTTTWGAIAGGGGATTFPFYKADDTLDTIAITSGQFPFYKADGTLDNIGVS